MIPPIPNRIEMIFTIATSGLEPVELTELLLLSARCTISCSSTGIIRIAA